MVVTCYIKLFRSGANRHNGILMLLLLLLAETIKQEVGNDLSVCVLLTSRLKENQNKENEIVEMMKVLHPKSLQF